MARRPNGMGANDRGARAQARLLRVYDATTKVRAARRDTELALAINRSDYMLDEPSGRLLQVELNTIASSFGCLATLVSRLHCYILTRAGRPAADLARLPPNDATGEIADALAAAVAEFRAGGGAADSVVLMVVQPGERNAFDQQWLQEALWERHTVRTLRRGLAQIGTEAELGGDGTLKVAGHSVAVTYFRAGYSPDDYPTEAEWGARELLEQSSSVQCPSVAYQLAGAKKVQQDLARPGIVEQFLSAPEDAAAVRECFAGVWLGTGLSSPIMRRSGLKAYGLWSLDDSGKAAEVISDARAHPERYVLKPQREGGGNNLYGIALAERLASPVGLAAFILMQRIFPPVQPAAMVREGKVVEADTLSELGVYGTFLRRGAEVLLNREAGHLVRTKAASSDEGGVAAGFAVLDSPALTD